MKKETAVSSPRYLPLQRAYSYRGRHKLLTAAHMPTEPSNWELFTSLPLSNRTGSGGKSHIMHGTQTWVQKNSNLNILAA